jgi:hypothetical protein
MDAALHHLSDFAVWVWHLWDNAVMGVLALPPSRILMLMSLVALTSEVIYLSRDYPYHGEARHGFTKKATHLLINGMLAVAIFQFFLILLAFAGTMIPLWFEFGLPAAVAVGILFVTLWDVIDRRSFDVHAFYHLAVVPLLSPIIPFGLHLDSLWRSMLVLIV